jgi:hypothetical protein
MASLRISIDLAIPDSPTGTTVLKNLDDTGGITIPTAVATKLASLRTQIRDFKQYARKINEGQGNEEASVSAQVFICHHDTNGVLPDEPK